MFLFLLASAQACALLYGLIWNVKINLCLNSSVHCFAFSLLRVGPFLGVLDDCLDPLFGIHGCKTLLYEAVRFLKALHFLFLWS
jgi:hypothetical protein